MSSLVAAAAPAPRYAKLKLWVFTDQNPDLLEKYRSHVEEHNRAVLNDSHPNSGFDLFVANQEYFNKPFMTKLVNHSIKCAMYYGDLPAAFYLYPRSSIYKTPFMLANSVGVIDSGYRGFICSAIRYFTMDTDGEDGTDLHAGTRITQICHPSLCPILVEIVDSEEDLGTTARGEGGFGSTGR